MHIEYYEGKQNTTMHLMRDIHEKFSKLIVVPKLITDINSLTQKY